MKEFRSVTIMSKILSVTFCTGNLVTITSYYPFSVQNLINSYLIFVLPIQIKKFYKFTLATYETNMFKLRKGMPIQSNSNDN